MKNKVLAVIVFSLIIILADLSTMKDTYSLNGQIETIQGNTVRIVDEDGCIWLYDGLEAMEGDRVVLKMHNMGTASERDDVILKIEVVE